MSELQNSNTNWIQTPISKFGFKCIMNKHDFCDNSLCDCLCHPANFSKIGFRKKNKNMESTS